MSEITEFILTKYYGFGVNPENKKFVTSHEANYDSTKFERSSETTDASEIEITAENSGHGTSTEVKSVLNNTFIFLRKTTQVANGRLRVSVIRMVYLSRPENYLWYFPGIIPGKLTFGHEITYNPIYGTWQLHNARRIEDRTYNPFGRTQAVKDEVEDSSLENSMGVKTIRSSRAILDDEDLENVDSDTNIFEALLEPPPPQKERPPGEEIKIIDELILLTPKKNEGREDNEETSRNDSTLGYFDDVSPENVSDISSIPAKKKPKKKSALTTASIDSSQPPPPPRKLPACNGVFLDLTNLGLTEFPINMIENIPNLRMLYLENNSLTELPEELFSNLKLLRWLDVRNNNLTTLPNSIKYHPCLETILLEGNLFEKLPMELGLLPNLKELQTSRNPLIFPPADILALGFAATIHFLRNEWNASHPDEVVETPERDKKPRPSTILCSDPPISRTSSKSSRLFGCSSTGHVSEGTSKISVREKRRNYKPSNRCESLGTNEELEARLLWISKVKEMLIKQAVTLQKIKDRDALSEWRRDRRSYEKSISKAVNRTEENIPFAVNVEDFAAIFKNRLKMPVGGSRSKKRVPAPPRDINEKMMQLYESLNQLQEARKSESLSPRSEQKLLEKQIKNLSELHDEIQNLKRYNEMSTAPFEKSALLPESQPYKPPPSIII